MRGPASRVIQVVCASRLVWVALLGIFALGAYADDDNGETSGSAYVFRDNGASWVEEQKLTAADAAAGDFFGDSVSVSGGLALVGAPYYDNDSVPIFKLNEIYRK